MRRVRIHTVNIEVIEPEGAESRADVQERVMDAVEAAGLEVVSAESVVLREASIPDRKGPAAEPEPGPAPAS